MKTVSIKQKIAAFTAVELLVVVVIIAVLAALVYPVYRLAVVSGKRTACVANLRQIGTGIGLYAADTGNGEWTYYEALNITGPNRGTWSSAIVWNNDYNAFNGVGKVYPYLKDKKVFVCPNNLQAKKGILELQEWEGASQNIFASYVARGFSQTYKSTTGDPNNAIGKKMFHVTDRAIVSCFFMQSPGNPNYPLSWHELSWPVLFGDGSVIIAEGYPPTISPTTNVWGVTASQWRFWDYFDTCH